MSDADNAQGSDMTDAATDNLTDPEATDLDLIVEDEPTPVEPALEESPAEEEASAVQEEAPAVQEEAPAVQEEAPAVQEEAPAAQEEAPAVQEEAPAIEEEAPAAAEEAPPAPVRKRVPKKPAVAEAEDDGDAEDEDRSPFDGPGDWYVIHTYAGYENKVKVNLGSRIQSMQMEEKIFDVVIPMEDVMEIKGGKRQVVQKKVFPGYLLVKMVYDNDSWYVVRNTPGVTGFVVSGTGSKPTPLSRREVEKILAVKQETKAKPTYRLEWEEGDVVRIVIGPFADFTGTIAEINVEQSKLKVMVNIFDRETPVELAFDQVAKA
jgi:transcriptional antiterminator NusG